MVHTPRKRSQWDSGSIIGHSQPGFSPALSRSFSTPSPLPLTRATVRLYFFILPFKVCPVVYWAVCPVGRCPSQVWTPYRSSPVSPPSPLTLSCGLFPAAEPRAAPNGIRETLGIRKTNLHCNEDLRTSRVTPLELIHSHPGSPPAPGSWEGGLSASIQSSGSTRVLGGLTGQPLAAAHVQGPSFGVISSVVLSLSLLQRDEKWEVRLLMSRGSRQNPEQREIAFLSCTGSLGITLSHWGTSGEDQPTEGSSWRGRGRVLQVSSTLNNQQRHR